MSMRSILESLTCNETINITPEYKDDQAFDKTVKSRLEIRRKYAYHPLGVEPRAPILINGYSIKKIKDIEEEEE